MKMTLFFCISIVVFACNSKPRLEFEDDYVFIDSNPGGRIRDKNYAIALYCDSINAFIVHGGSFPKSLSTIHCLDELYPDYGFHIPDRSIPIEISRCIHDTVKIDLLISKIDEAILMDSISMGSSCSVKYTLKQIYTQRRNCLTISMKLYDEIKIRVN